MRWADRESNPKYRLFKIWQKTGVRPFQKEGPKREPITCSSCGNTFDTPYCPHCGQAYKDAGKRSSFFHGSFDSIPFLNDDAKRTFVHLLLRPGYMMRDYLSGLNSRYLAPMTSLIIFYAFFALMSGILSPSFSNDGEKSLEDSIFGNISVQFDDGPKEEYSDIDEALGDNISEKLSNSLVSIQNAMKLFVLDKHPEFVDSKAKASLAAAESALRSQGVFSFIWQLFALTIAVFFSFRFKRKVSFSASATISSYILCQFCFFMLIVLVCTAGHSDGPGAMVKGAIMTIDYHQLFGMGWKASIRRTIFTALLFWFIVIIAISAFFTIMAVFS